MPIYFQRPENALKRANEFLEVGKKEPALDALCDVIKSKRHRTWQKVHVEILEKYLTLCVELRRGHLAKEGLYQYKLICQQVSIGSLEDSIRYFLKLSNDKAEEARQESQQVVLDIEDLDQIQTPESLLLSAVSAEDTQARTDRVMLTPWVKFLWEAYRSVLDLLRNNAKVEKLYHDVAQEAFQFCVKYSRRTEFRKLCDNLRQHLLHVQKFQNQANSINLNSPESLQLHVETRLNQLDTAIGLDLWQEAFKAIEDIHGLLHLSKKAPRPAMVANYLQKQAKVYWMAGNPLFHAAACHRLLVLSREQKKNLTETELERLALKAVCATLAVPMHSAGSESNFTAELNEIARDKTRRLAALLQLQSPPTRASLIRDVKRFGMLEYVPKELSDLFTYLEMEFHPLQLCARVAKCLEFVEEKEDLNQYVNKIKTLATARLLQQVAQVYQSMELSRLSQLAPFTNESGLERSIVNAAKLCDLQVRIDHRTQSVNFGADVTLVEQAIDGPLLQSMPSETLRCQLSGMSSALRQAMQLVAPGADEVGKDADRQAIAELCKASAHKEHRLMLRRKTIIEKRKEDIESLTQARERHERQQEEKERQKALEAEKERLKKEADERERQRKEEERKAIGKSQVMERIKEMSKSSIGEKVVNKIKDWELETLDADDLVRKQVEEMEREKKELANRWRILEKKVDYWERAKRLEEISLLSEQYENQLKIDQEFHEQQEEEHIQTAIAERRHAEEISRHLAVMQDDKDAFLTELKGARYAAYQAEMKDFQQLMESERTKRMEDRRQQRVKKRKQDWLIEQREKREREREERERKAQEEEERRRKEEEDRKRKEYEEKMAKLQEQEEKQRKREREIEEKLARERQEKSAERERERAAERDHDQGGGDWRSVSDDRRRGGRDRGSEDWRGGRDDRPPRDDRPSRDDRDWGRGPPRDDRPREDWRGGPPRGGPRDGPRDDRDRDWGRGAPPRDDRDRDWGRGAPPRDDRDRDWGRGAPPRDDRDRDWGRGAPPRDERDWRRGPPRDDRPRDDWRGGPPRGGGPRDGPRRDEGSWR